MTFLVPAVSRSAATLVIAAGAGMAQAQSQPVSHAGAAAGWSFEISPYVWAAGIDGMIRPRRGFPSFNSSLSFSDILDNLDAGFFVTGSARRDRLVISGDLYYISLSDTVRAPAPADFLRIKGKAGVVQGTLVGGWRAVDGAAHSLDLMAGVRAGESDVEVQGRIGGRPELTVSDDISYAAPVLAMRGRVALSDRFTVTGYGDLGGGTSSVDSTWQLSATLDYHLSDRVALSAGYRHEELDISNSSGARADTATSGFLIGTRLSF